jgi:predicted esterase
MTEVRTIRAATHGRYLVAAPDGGTHRDSPVLVGFHGYAEDAATHLARLQTIPDAGRWLIVSVQALHRFYRRQSQEVVASWMTRQDRELMIDDNIAYASAVVDEVRRGGFSGGALVLAGFSQGVAVAFRAAARGSHPPAAVIALGGDVPPELDGDAIARIPRILIGRGDRDPWYSPETFAADEARLRAASVAVTTHAFSGAHEWTGDFSRAAGEFLAGLA